MKRNGIIAQASEKLVVYLTRRNILVIGSAHLDVIGEFEDFSDIDKKGEVVYSIGGTAYNISVNLAGQRLRCFLFTYLKKASIISRIIWNKLVVRGVKRKYVHRVVTVGGAGPDRPILSESGFVAHRDNTSKDISAAVTRTAITDVTLSEGYQVRELERLRRAIRRATCVVADCNLSSELLEKIIQCASEHNKKVIVPMVSESKANHLIEMPPRKRQSIYVAAGNVEEIFTSIDEYTTAKAKLPPDQPVHSRRELANSVISQIGGIKEVARRLCDSFNSEFVSVSWGDQRCQLMTQSGEMVEIQGPRLSNPDIVTRTGAGDAWTSALVHEIFENKVLDPTSPSLRGRCNDYLGIVLRQQGATVGSTLALDEVEETPPKTVGGKLIAALRRWVIVLGVEHAWGALLLFLAGAVVSRVLALLPISSWFGRLPTWIVAW